MEIEDSSFEYIEDVTVTSDPDMAFDNADIGILIGGYPRQPGMERRDLLAKNIDIMRIQGQSIERKANRDIKIVVVANPSNTNCLVCMAYAPSIPKKNFTCLTRLDHERLRGGIVRKVNDQLKSSASTLMSRNLISPSHVKNICIFGNHSTSQVPYTQQTEIYVDNGWRPMKEVLEEEDDSWISTTLEPSVQNRGAAVMKSLQSSSALSAARATALHLRDWLAPVPTVPIESIPGESCLSQEKYFSMGVYSSESPYNVPDGLIYSFPCMRHGDGFKIVSNLPINERMSEMMQWSTAELQQEKRDCEAILGISFSELLS
eukprot:CAMPEP_0182419144 /NCGR_PEP_ID=MMETSP1167-20130531/3545_1 /TAXON_ID=2988 /ORGANISM="Mallomonas Sp, Strain CCMP3275" /LENGTH=317 /DNA_ID=CAMNT_0024593797 /DNA_START=205 /DNA_END=1161 /DNA_ORIENTATION=+